MGLALASIAVTIVTTLVYGPDLAVLRTKTEEIESALAKIDGIDGVHRDLLVEVPQIEVEVDLAAAQRYGIKPGDVRRAAATIVSGEEVGDIFRDGDAEEAVLDELGAKAGVIEE